ncbi:HlyD family type I secretion periplasmic adaptor subunit [Marinagarivorans algicola]|uniref:HlyD family type I secretion periplasmic adaptor subunit n=1 Tax=Marinagarivorans algicola TaxID=1513270 RepID=UPI0006B8E02F|nr:HlyD family type I secretion periplasmic adaptor subunit [Marinagarivorans algicola]
MKLTVNEFLKQHKLSQSEQEQLVYMPQSVKLEEAVNPHMVRITMIVISMAILIFFLWAAFTKISEVTSAVGEVIPRGYTQIVQHFEGALVKEILIRDGDVVDKDQILIKLEDSSATQSLAEARQKYKSILTQTERNNAFLEKRELDFSRIDDITSKDIDFQKKVYDEMLSSVNKEYDVLNNQVSQKEIEIKKLKHRLNHLIKGLKLTDEAREIQKKLLDKGYASRIAYIKYEQEYHKTSSELEETEELYAQAVSSLSEYRMRLSSLSLTRREQVYSELADLQSQADQVKEGIIRLEDRVNRLTIRSPVHGIVKGLQLNTIGGVVEPGKALLEVVPLSAKLIVEAQVSPKDVGHIEVGQAIRVKVSSFDFSRYGTVSGTLDYVSATTFLNEKREPYYKVRIGLEKMYVGNNSNMNNILPGMTVVGDIITGEKTILSYLFKPIHLSLKTAFSER